MKKLTSKDLITIGIFSVVFIAFIFVIACVQVVPLLCVAMPPLMALFTGPIYLLFVAKTQKPFCISILGLIVSVVVGFFVFGSVYIFLFNFVFFIIAELIAKIKDYKSFNVNLISYIICSLWVFGEISVYWVAKDWIMTRSIDMGIEAEFVNDIFKLATPLSLVILVVITFVLALLSGLFAKQMFKKHFKRSGII